MTKNEKTPLPSTHVKTDSVTISMREGEDQELRAAEAVSGPFISNAFAFNVFTRGTVGDVSLNAHKGGHRKALREEMRGLRGLLKTWARVAEEL